ncbi:MAG TPA: efflux RND transporter periplasmic adaptor subunit [Thermoanaerobaculia bacterium]|nr:efflux RND transporter periplasmic adaptor subunit [Thermoanaerobaculia bacterium]
MSDRRRILSPRALGLLVAAVIAAAVLAAILAALAAQAALSPKLAGDGPGSAAGESGWAEVRRGDLVLSVPVSGALAAEEAARLGPPPATDLWDFKIVFMAPEGTTVRRGQPVLAFDTSTLEKTLRDKEAERDSAQKQLEKASADLALARSDGELHLAEAAADRRRAELAVAVPPELKSRNELASARADLELAARKTEYQRHRLQLTATAAAAQLRSLTERRDRAAARVAEVRAAIARMHVAAPRDGTVVYLPNPRGEKKQVGDSCWRREQVMEIPDLGRLRADGEIDEADAGRVAAGQTVALRLDAHPEMVFTGRVAAIKSAVRQRAAALAGKMVRIEIALARTDPLRMRPGMRFAGAIELDRAPRVLLAPLAAVRSLPDGPLVVRRTRFGAETVRPRLGRHDDRQVEVLAGLAPGDLVQVQAEGGVPPAAAAGAAPAPATAGIAGGVAAAQPAGGRR